MSDLYLIGALPLWLIALVGLAAAALLAQQFINLRQRLPLGQSCLSHFTARLRLCGIDFLFAWPGVDRQARDQAAPAADTARRHLAEHELSGER